MKLNKRLDNFYPIDLLDTSYEEAFDNIAHSIRILFDVSVVLITLNEIEKVWLNNSSGLKSSVGQTHGGIICSIAVQENEINEFTTFENPNCLNNPLIAGRFGLRFYASVPLQTQEGFKIGSICILDKNIRALSFKKREALIKFSNIVLDHLEMRKNLKELAVA